MVEVDRYGGWIGAEVDRCEGCAVARAVEDEGCTTLIVEIVETERANTTTRLPGTTASRATIICPFLVMAVWLRWSKDVPVKIPSLLLPPRRNLWQSFTQLIDEEAQLNERRKNSSTRKEQNSSNEKTVILGEVYNSS